MEAAGIAPASPTETRIAEERQIRHEASPHANVPAPPPTLVLANPSARTPCLEAESCLEHELAVSPIGQLSVVSCQLLRDKTPGGRRPLLAGAVELGVLLLDANVAPGQSPLAIRSTPGVNHG